MELEGLLRDVEHLGRQRQQCPTRSEPLAKLLSLIHPKLQLSVTLSLIHPRLQLGVTLLIYPKLLLEVTFFSHSPRASARGHTHLIMETVFNGLLRRTSITLLTQKLSKQLSSAIALGPELKLGLSERRVSSGSLAFRRLSSVTL